MSDMAQATQTTRLRLWLWLIALLGVIVPRRLRAEWRQEWEAELRYREALLADWDKLNWRTKLDLLRRSLGAFWDALWLQQLRWEDEMIQDLRYGMRMLLKHKGFTAIAVLCLALGIGANTAIFSVVNAVLLRALPYHRADQLVMVWETNRERSLGHEQPSPGNFLDWRAQNQVFDGIAAWYQTTRTLRDDEAAMPVQTAQVAGDFFQLLGTEPALGRTFSPAETAGASYNTANGYLRGDRLAVISDGLWRRRFGGDSGVIGRSISIDGADWQIVAVMPPGFAIPNREVEIWTQWDLTRFADARDARFLQTLARLKSGVTVEQAQAQLGSVAGASAEQYPQANKGWSVSLVPLQEETVGKSRSALLVMFGAVGFVLLIVCANVASLLLARASSRQREMAVRSALGASRLRLKRQLLTESVLLSLAGGVLGLEFAFWGIKLLLFLQPGNLPRIDEIGLDTRVVIFTIVTTIATGIACGVASALQASQTDLTTALKEAGPRGTTGGFRHHRFRSMLVAAEIAIALVLLVGAGLLTRSFTRMLAVNPGFDSGKLLVLPIFLDNNRYRTPAQSSSYYQRLIERLKTLPAVTAVGATTALPMSDVGVDFDRPYWREGEEDPGGAAPKAAVRMVTPDYFKTMGISVEAGRDFTEEDRPETPSVMVINEMLAQQIWPGTDPVGKRLMIYFNRGRYPYQIIGVVGDIKHYGLKSQARPEVFFAHAQDPYLIMNVVVRTSADPRQLVQVLSREVLKLDPAQPARTVVSMDQLISRSLSPDRFSMLLLGVLAAMALVLATVGIYGIMAYTVSQRTHEIGIRMALGARPRDVLRLVVGQGMRLTAIGVVLGLAAAFALTRVMASLLFGVSATDPATFGGIAFLLTGVAFLACYLPARGASREDPMIALRHE
jgi:putative ABC transport system permease protein